MMPIRLAVLDDDEALCGFIAGFLDRFDDFEVVGHYHDEQELIDVAKDNTKEIDIAVVDIALRRKSGMDVTRELLEIRPELKVIAITGMTDAGLVDAMITAGAHGFIFKPASEKIIPEAIRTVHSGKRYLCQHAARELAQTFYEKVKEGDEAKLEKLSEREIEILRGIADGKSTKELAKKFGVTEKTIELRRREIKKKTGVDSIVDLTKFAIRRGLTKIF